MKQHMSQALSGISFI